MPPAPPSWRLHRGRAGPQEAALGGSGAAGPLGLCEPVRRLVGRPKRPAAGVLVSAVADPPRPGPPGPFPPVGGEDPEKPFCPCSELPQPEGSPQSNSLPSTAWGVRGRAPPMAWPEICTQAPPGCPRSLTQRRSFLLKWEAEWILNPGWQGRGQGDKRS